MTTTVTLAEVLARIDEECAASADELWHRLVEAGVPDDKRRDIMAAAFRVLSRAHNHAQEQAAEVFARVEASVALRPAGGR